jgi:hypothetical protein
MSVHFYLLYNAHHSAAVRGLRDVTQGAFNSRHKVAVSPMGTDREIGVEVIIGRVEKFS